MPCARIKTQRSCRIYCGCFWGQVRQVSIRNALILVVVWWNERRTGCPCLWTLNSARAAGENCSDTCLCSNSHFWGTLLYYKTFFLMPFVKTSLFIQLRGWSCSLSSGSLCLVAVCTCVQRRVESKDRTESWALLFIAIFSFLSCFSL